MQIPSDIKYVSSVVEKLVKEVTPLGLDEGIVHNLKLSIGEVVTNAIVHGNKLRSELLVKITSSVDKERIEIEVEDEGDGFDYRNLPDPRHQESITKPSGRGLFLICQVMDEVHFNDKGNKVKMVKYLR